MERKREIERSELNLQTIWNCTCQYWWIIVLTTVLAIILAICKGSIEGKAEIETKYSATVMFYVEKKGEISEAGNCVTLVESSLLLDMLGEELKNRQLSTLKEGGEKIISERLNNGDFFSLTVEGTDREREIYITNLLAELFLKQAKEILDVNCWVINDVGVVAIENENNGFKNNNFQIIAFGLLFGCIILAAIMVFNDKIWSCYDVEKCFGDNYLGCYSKKSQDWIPWIQYQCKKKAINGLYIVYSDKGKKGEKIFEQITQMDDSIQVLSIRQLEYENIMEQAKAFLVIERGVDTYKGINQILMSLRWFDIEILGCVCV